MSKTIFLTGPCSTTFFVVIGLVGFVGLVLVRNGSFFGYKNWTARWTARGNGTRATTMSSKKKRSDAVGIEPTRRGIANVSRVFITTHPSILLHSTHTRNRRRKVRSASVSSRRSPPRPHPPRIVPEAQAPQPRHPRQRPTILTLTSRATTRLRTAPTVRTTTRMKNRTTRSGPGGTRQTTTPVQVNGTGS